MEGELKEPLTAPDIAAPPDETIYQRYCPLVPPDAVRVTTLVPHDELPVVVGAVGGVFIVATAEVRTPSHIPLLMAT